MQNYLAGLTISFILHLGLVLSFINFFRIDLLYSVNSISPMPIQLIYEKSEIILKEKKINMIKEIIREKVVSPLSIIEVTDSKAELASIEVEKTLLSKAKEKVEVTGLIEGISAYSNLIRDQVMTNWKPPTLFEIGTKSELIITLVPTGEIINVRISKESGNKAFDRSALAAVYKVDKFEGLDMRRKLFDEHFRVFTLVFNPKD